VNIRPIPETKFRSLFKPPFPTTLARLYRELEWYATDRDRLLGTVVLDKTDNDYSWAVLCQDAQGEYRSPANAVSLPTRKAAREALLAAMEKASQQSNAELHQAQDAIPGGLTAEEHSRVLDEMVAQEVFLSGNWQRWRR